MTTERPETATAALCQMIRKSFPSETYNGLVTTMDGQWTPELDEERALCEELNSKRWTDIQDKVVKKFPDGFLLLTIDAYRAFFPAWLMRSLENLRGENEVRNFVIYSFLATSSETPFLMEWRMNRLRIFSSDQRMTLRLLLVEFAKHDPSSYNRECAEKALALISEFDRTVGRWPGRENSGQP